MDYLYIENKFLKKEDIEGICELDENAPVGGDPIAYLNLDDEIIDSIAIDKVEIKSQTGIAYNTRAHYSTRYHEQEDHGYTHGSRFHPAHSDCINFV